MTPALDRLLRFRKKTALVKANRWTTAALLELELDLLMASARLPDAWEATRRYVGLLLRLVQASEATLDDESGHDQPRGDRALQWQTHRGGHEETCRLLRKRPLPATVSLS